MIDGVDKPWTSLWKDRITCGQCGGIRTVEVACPACDGPPYSTEASTVRFADGQEFEVPAVFMGAEGRREDYTFISLMEREWLRPPQECDPCQGWVALRVLVVLIYWTYFESRIERLLRVALWNRVDQRNEKRIEKASMVRRMTDIYEALFGTTYAADLSAIGSAQLWTHMEEVRVRRNRFIHGDPSAIDDAFIAQVVARMKDEHDAWIKVFNRRIRAMRDRQAPTAVPPSLTQS